MKKTMNIRGFEISVIDNRIVVVKDRLTIEGFENVLEMANWCYKIAYERDKETAQEIYNQIIKEFSPEDSFLEEELSTIEINLHIRQLQLSELVKKEEGTRLTYTKNELARITKVRTKLTRMQEHLTKSAKT